MNKFLSICLLATLFAGASAFTTEPVKPVSNDQPETMLTVDLTQTGPGEATGTWTSTSGGPYHVTLTNLSTGQRIFFNPNFTGNSQVFTGLTNKTKYRLTVGDVNFLSDEETITF
jgi:hypothetical protein